MPCQSFQSRWKLMKHNQSPSWNALNGRGDKVCVRPSHGNHNSNLDFTSKTADISRQLRMINTNALVDLTNMQDSWQRLNCLQSQNGILNFNKFLCNDVAGSGSGSIMPSSYQLAGEVNVRVKSASSVLGKRKQHNDFNTSIQVTPFASFRRKLNDYIDKGGHNVYPSPMKRHRSEGLKILVRLPR